MAEQVPHSQDPASANLMQQAQVHSFAESVQSMLADECLANSGLASWEQGKVVVDTFIGELVAKNGVTSEHSQERTNAYEVLQHIDYANQVANDKAVIEKGGWDYASRLISRGQGLRDAVNMLAADERTGRYFGNFSNLVKVSSDGKIGLTSMHQLDGYLNALGQKRPDQTWVNTMVREVEDYAQGSSLAALWDKNTQKNLAGSDVGKVRQSLVEWQRAEAAAEAAGADLSVIALSAEAMKERVDAGQAIAHIALRDVAPVRTYDYLFE